MERSSHVLVQQSGRYHGSGCHNAAKIAQRWSASRAGLQRWVGLQPAQLCDGLPAQTQSSEPVTACDSCVTAAWQLAGVTDTNSFSGRQSLRRVRPGQVAWPRGLHRMVMVTRSGDQGSVSEQDLKCEIQTFSWYMLCLLLPFLFCVHLREERFCEIKILVLMEYWSGKVLKRATSGRLQTVPGAGGSKGHTPVTSRVSRVWRTLNNSWRTRWCVRYVC